MTARPRKADPTVTKPDFAALLAGAKLPERVVDICMRADLTVEFERLDQELTKLVEKPPQKFSGDGRVALRDQLEAVEAEMRANTYPFTLRALSKPKFRALIAAHPPRRDDKGAVDERDRALRLNSETFFDALARACIVDPVLDDATWAELNEKLTDRQIDELATAAWSLNREDVDIPFSRGVSLMNQSSEPESK